jgi:glycosyltransferase involved in cell wall biosynthesis
MAPAKNLPRLIDAISRCQENGITLHVDWIGREDDLSEAAIVKALVITRGLERNWSWWGERRDIPERLRACDALIAPSLWEGLPNAICEALASGVPVLASAVSDNDRLVPDGVHGFTFASEDTASIADAITRFAALAMTDREAMGRRGRAFAEQHLGLATCINSYERLLALREHLA